MQTFAKQNHHVTLQELTNEIKGRPGSVHSILNEDLIMRTVPVEFVAKLLMMKQKQLHLKVSQDIFDCTSSNPSFLNSVITCDKLSGATWKPRSSTHNPWAHNPKQVCSNIKVMMTIFFYSHYVVHHEMHHNPKTLQPGSCLILFMMLCDANNCICG